MKPINVISRYPSWLSDRLCSNEIERQIIKMMKDIPTMTTWYREQYDNICQCLKDQDIWSMIYPCLKGIDYADENQDKEAISAFSILWALAWVDANVKEIEETINDYYEEKPESIDLEMDELEVIDIRIEELFDIAERTINPNLLILYIFTKLIILMEKLDLELMQKLIRSESNYCQNNDLKGLNGTKAERILFDFQFLKHDIIKSKYQI